MSALDRRRASLGAYRGAEPAQLADVLERVLDKGIVIAGDIRIDLLDIELLTVRLRLLVASVDKAKEMGIDWWERDPFLSRSAERQQLEERVERLESALRERGELEDAREEGDAEARDERDDARDERE